ncbi:MAG: efflux RND transporter periplasmic adaptor subunit [Sulfuricurvum sp.]|jgi:hypothetical protein|uniref:efflux RND transporter periplasmic adaptor subunit n=1 Tax=Sulfuricurvum sp. TaxID=2025608 RepID=UPI0025EE5C5A|nr:efflux RND transporter periplasmic adaptor subunit [Sulfuricurvum sp.]MCI4406502.1 efflux RND transporter periplasmic adaptor subunit [Sulfuricurvum sp.]
MKKSIFLLMIATAMMADIKMSDAQMKKMGIVVQPVREIKSEAMGPFIGAFDYNDKGARNYTLSSEATVAELMKQTGDTVKQGEVICTIASSELLASSYELKDLRNRLKLAQEYAKKDQALYQDGVISLRESQKSALEVMSLKAKIGEIENRFVFSGADISPKNGMMFAIRARQSGILAHAPLKAGEKIEPFMPYLKIARANALSTYIKIPPKMIGSIQKGAAVMDKTGKEVGKITAISSGVDTMSNSATAIAVLNSNNNYRAGTSGEFYIASVQTDKWILLPTSSVTKYKKNDICFVKNANGFTPQIVEVQKTYKDHVAIKPSGLNSTSKVATDGIITLKGALNGLGFE